MRKIFVLLFTVTLVIAAASVSSASEETVRDQIKDLLFEYKDAYNLRNFDSIRALYTKDALITSFACNSDKEVPFSEFSDDLGRCSTYWVEGAFKLRLFKITSFSVDGDKCTARVSWDYRDNRNRGKFNPTFEFRRVGGKWKISKENYGRKPI
ncbi:nuclear transport factor 2 family protein [Maridesulfovibrio sp.]|uniref:nuclear transport factor 2 family protein n=1 Tax=Maridesulfovibrio sp. TaxID=2795000 RepID=UPI002A18A5F3|nr:nuclear transport factor 2 family protein [Maridesulfovibrio sp.]